MYLVLNLETAGCCVFPTENMARDFCTNNNLELYNPLYDEDELENKHIIVKARHIKNKRDVEFILYNSSNDNFLPLIAEYKDDLMNDDILTTMDIPVLYMYAYEVEL